MKKLFKISLVFIISVVSIVGLIVCSAAFLVLSSPDVSQLKNCMTTSMYNVELCPGTAKYVPLKNIPDHLIEALIVSEDSTFYHHSGFDWFELKESFSENIEHKTMKRGGSTLTQQLAKNVFLSPEKSILRKLREAYITHQLEAQFSKSEILEKYLNVVEFGKDTYGIKAASQYYFNKSPQDLHILESAFLVMLLPNPKKYSQSYREGALTAFAKRRVSTIINRLLRFKKISSAEHDFALENIDQFPWRHLSSSDFQFSIPALPEELSGEINTSSGTTEDISHEQIEEEINQMEEPAEEYDDEDASPFEAEPNE